MNIEAQKVFESHHLSSNNIAKDYKIIYLNLGSYRRRSIYETWSQLVNRCIPLHNIDEVDSRALATSLGRYRLLKSIRLKYSYLGTEQLNWNAFIWF